ncbi:MAG TPA: hypothetical protein VIO61_13370 [Anaerolineaceae bacterium]
MEANRFPRFLSVLWVTLVLITIGGGGLIILIWTTVPFLWARWLFFFLFTLVISGLVLPLVFILNRRFATHPPADAPVLIREAIFVGILGSTIAWLQIGRMLQPGTAIFLGIGLLIIEALLRWLEHSRWKPKEIHDE